MSTQTATVTSPEKTPSSPSGNLLQEFPTISPTLRQHWKTKRPGGSYGCVREVYHPLSPLAEPSAAIFYDSDADPEDEDGVGALSSSTSILPQGFKSPLDDASPLANRRNNTCVSASRSGNLNRSPTKETTHRRTKSEVKSPAALNLSRKRASQPDVSELLGIHSPLLHLTRAEEEKEAKRSKSDFSARKLNYGHSPNESDEKEASGSDSTNGPVVEAVFSSGPGSSQKPEIGGTPNGGGEVSPQGSRSPLSTLQDSPKFMPPVLAQPKHLGHRTPTQVYRGRLPTTSPRRFPLPESPDQSGLDSLSSTPSLSLECSPLRELSPSITPQGLEGKGRAAAHAEALANKLQILHIKAQQYSESITRPTLDRKLAQELDALFSKENRFDPQEAAKLEAEYQHKIRAIYEKRLLEEQRQVELERQEQERIRATEAARKAAEERERREEEERRRREQEELERKRKEEEAAKARAEQEKRDAEAKRQAEEKARLEQEARLKAEKDQAAAAKALQDAQVARIAQAAQAQIPGRRSFESEAANVQRVLTNLAGVRKQLDADFLKSSGLKQIRRDLVPKLGQLNGVKDQTLAVRESIKAFLNQVIAMSSPSTNASLFLFYPPAQEIPVSVAFVWVVNELAKLAVRQVKQECTFKPDAADPVGVVLAAIFADSKYSPGGGSLIDIFVARFLKRNPILLGEDGPDATEPDRIRLGWHADPVMGHEREDEYIGRVQAYTAGFVAIAARNFSKSNYNNPYPPYNLWNSLASLLNKPPDKLTNSHYFIVHTILLLAAKKLCNVYGIQAKKMIEVAVGPWADLGMQSKHPGAHAVQSAGLYIKKQSWWP